MPTSCCTVWLTLWKSGARTVSSAGKKAHNDARKGLHCRRGPGAADLLTLRAATVLRTAQVVLHDDLVPQEILDLCPASAQVVNVGKRCGHRGRSQQQINGLMVWHARETEAQTLVRLKSGDPAVFGRLGEELDALRRAGVEFEIFPGITAASAAAASAKITLTDRRAASALVVATAHNCRNESLSKTVEPARSTYALYMPGPDYSKTVQGLFESGHGPETAVRCGFQCRKRRMKKCAI